MKSKLITSLFQTVSGIGQNQNFQFSCEKDSEYEIQHFINHELVIFKVIIESFLLRRRENITV